MRKFGESIKQGIRDAYRPFAKAHTILVEDRRAKAEQAEAVKEMMTRNISGQTLH